MLLGKWRGNKFKIGARVLKTGIAIVLTLYLAELLNLPLVFAAIGASFAIQPTVYRSYISLVDQLLANIVGAIVAIVLVLTIGSSPAAVGLGVMITIWVTRLTKKDNHIGIAVITLLVIMEAQGSHFIEFATQRFIAIILGVLVAFFINIWLLPPKYEAKLFRKISDFTELVLIWLNRCIDTDKQSVFLRNDQEGILKKQVAAEKVYLLYKDERKFYKKKREYTKARKLVVYRQMIATTRQAFVVLKQFHRWGHYFDSFPLHFRSKLLAQMTILIQHHQQIHEHFIQDSYDQKVFEATSLGELLSLLAELREMKSHDVMAILHMTTLTGALIEYAERIQHLQGLLHSFQSYHEMEKVIDETIET